MRPQQNPISYQEQQQQQRQPQQPIGTSSPHSPSLPLSSCGDNDYPVCDSNSCNPTTEVHLLPIDPHTIDCSRPLHRMSVSAPSPFSVPPVSTTGSSINRSPCFINTTSIPVVDSKLLRSSGHTESIHPIGSSASSGSSQSSSCIAQSSHPSTLPNQGLPSSTSAAEKHAAHTSTTPPPPPPPLPQPRYHPATPSSATSPSLPHGDVSSPLMTSQPAAVTSSISSASRVVAAEASSETIHPSTSSHPEDSVQQPVSGDATSCSSNGISGSVGIDGTLASSELKRERYPPPPLGRIGDPLTYGINLGIAGELVTSSDVENWEFPDIIKMKSLRDKLIVFMEENRLKQADICRFTGLGAPYLSFLVKDPTISNFSSRRRVEVYSVLQTFFNKIDRKEVTLDDIVRLVLLSKAAARAANSRRRGTQSKPAVLTPRRETSTGDPSSKPVVRRRRRGRPKLLERSRHDEFLSSGLRESSSDFNFDDFIASSIGSSRSNYLSHGLSNGGYGSLNNGPNWIGASMRSQRDGEHRQIRRRSSRKTPSERHSSGTESYNELYGNLEEWRHRAAALFNKDFGVVAGSVKGSSSSMTSSKAGLISEEQESAAEQQNKFYINEVLSRSQDLLDLQNRDALLQTLVNVEAMNQNLNTTNTSDELLLSSSSSSPVDEETKDLPQGSSSTTIPQRRKGVNEEHQSGNVLKAEEPAGERTETTGNANAVQERQTEILNALIHNLVHQDREPPSRLTPMVTTTVARPSSAIRASTPTWGLLQRKDTLKYAPSNDAVVQPPCSAVSPSQPQLARILQAMMDNQSEPSTTDSHAPRHRFEKSYQSNNSDDGLDLGRSGGLSEPLASGGSRIRFGRGWIREVDVGLLNGDPHCDISSNRALDDDSEFNFVLPFSGRICVVRLQWTWDGGNFDEDILWDMTDYGSSIDAFIDLYIKEMGLPRHPVGSQLLDSFRRQVDAARSFESMFEIVCTHLLNKLGHSNVKQLPGITRKLIIDCLHEGLRVIDAVPWNLTNSIFEARMFLRSLIKDLNLPSSFMSVLFAAFVRAIAKERLKFIDECSDVLLGNLRAEILGHNAWELKRHRKRGHGGIVTDRGREEEETAFEEDVQGHETKRLRRAEPPNQSENVEGDLSDTPLSDDGARSLTARRDATSSTDDLTTEQQRRSEGREHATDHEMLSQPSSTLYEEEEEDGDQQQQHLLPSSGPLGDLDEICSSELTSSDNEEQIESNGRLEQQQQQQAFHSSSCSESLFHSQPHQAEEDHAITAPTSIQPNSLLEHGEPPPSRYKRDSQVQSSASTLTPMLVSTASLNHHRASSSTPPPMATPPVASSPALTLAQSNSQQLNNSPSAVSSREFFPVTFKPTAMIGTTGATLPPSVVAPGFTGRVVSTRSVSPASPEQPSLHSQRLLTQSVLPSQQQPSDSLQQPSAKWTTPLREKVVPSRPIASSQTHPAQRRSGRLKSDLNLEEALSSIGPVVLRNCYPIMSRTVFHEALLNPSRLTTTSNEIINEEKEINK